MSKISLKKTKPPQKILRGFSLRLTKLKYNLAEAVRFELTEGFPSAVFKTAGLNHSPKPPRSAHDTEVQHEFKASLKLFEQK